MARSSRPHVLRAALAVATAAVTAVTAVAGPAGAQTDAAGSLGALSEAVTGQVTSGSAESGSAQAGSAGSGSADPASAAAGTAGTAFKRAALKTTGAKLVRSEDFEGDGQVKQLWIDSPAFGRVVRIGLLLPKDRSTRRPTLEMLDGFQGWQAAGDESLLGGSAWLTAGGARNFFRDGKNVNVVLSVDGGASFYRDWKQASPTQGKIAWDTFLAYEVPEIVDTQFEGNGSWGVSGLSMGAHSAFMQMTRHPDVYNTVVGFSGCYDTSTDFGQKQVAAVLSGQRVPAELIFGPPSDPLWKQNDPWLHLDSFRGKTIWMSAASGKPGVSDWDAIMTNPSSSADGSIGGLIPGAAPALKSIPKLDPVIAGSPYEAISMNCTRRFELELAQNGIPSTAVYEPTGLHTWELWASELPKAWPSIARGLGVVQS